MTRFAAGFAVGLVTGAAAVAGFLARVMKQVGL